MKIRHTLVLALALVAAGPVIAQLKDAHGVASDKAAAAGPLSEGEVRRIDRTTNRLVIKHGPIKNLDMAAMTMEFRVKDPALLDRIAAGDKVRFRAEQEGDVLFVTRIEIGK